MTDTCAHSKDFNTVKNRTQDLSPYFYSNLPPLRVKTHSGGFPYYALGFPQLLQKLPEFTCPHEQVQSVDGAGLPQLLQNFPLFTCPHEQVQPFASAGFGEPHSGQNLPVAVAPH